MRINIKYVSFIVGLTGKLSETRETGAATLKDLMLELDSEYPGLKQIFLPKDPGGEEFRAVIYLRRVGEPPRGVFATDFPIQEGDTYMLW